jgi:hypothetical protein
MEQKIISADQAKMQAEMEEARRREEERERKIQELQAEREKLISRKEKFMRRQQLEAAAERARLYSLKRLEEEIREKEEEEKRLKAQQENERTLQPEAPIEESDIDRDLRLLQEELDLLESVGKSCCCCWNSKGLEYKPPAKESRAIVHSDVISASKFSITLQ